jgi:hypothetical protein
VHNGPSSILVLGAVVLSVSGVEALYADLGHFSSSAIRFAWYAACLPALLLNYFGQGALALRDPHVLSSSSFYALYPGWTTLAMVGLSTMATVIASQALISGAFSMTQEARTTRLSAASAGPAHLVETSRANLYPGRQCDAGVRVYCRRARFPQQRPTRFRLRPHRHRHDARHVTRLRSSRTPPVQMAVARRIRAQCALPQC